MKTFIIIIIGSLAVFGLIDVIRTYIDLLYKKYFGGDSNEKNNTMGS